MLRPHSSRCWLMHNDGGQRYCLHRPRMLAALIMINGILRAQVPGQEKTGNMSLKEMLDNHSDGPGAALLKASELPAETKSITVEGVSIQEAPPDWRSPGILNYKKPIAGKTALALNKTNLKAIMKKFGDDESMVIGQKLKFDIISTRNPQTGDIGPSFAFRG